MRLLLKTLTEQPVGVIGVLHNRLTGGHLTAHEQGASDKAFIAHHRNFRRSAVFHPIQQRDDRVDREINKAARRTISGLKTRRGALCTTSLPVNPVIERRESHEKLSASYIQ